MKRILIVMEGHPEQRYGVFNSVVNRAKYLRAAAPDWQIDVMMVVFHDGTLLRRLRGSDATLEHPDVINADGLAIKVCWFERSWLDGAVHRLWSGRPHCYERWCRRWATTLPHYDLVSGHDLLGGLAARAVADCQGIPLCVTWHGASLYVDPFADTMVRRLTVELLQQATCNFTVSKALANVARCLSPTCRVTTLYNGVSSAFVRLDAAHRSSLRADNGLSPNEQVVAFVGRFDHDKGVMLLPELFEDIAQRAENVCFWTIGDGPLYESVQRMLNERPQLRCRLWGRQDPSMLPSLLNCVDVLLLPSRMEGLPLVALEALRCGAWVVGTDEGGTPEVVGDDNVFEVDDELAERMAQRAVQLLECKDVPTLDDVFSWSATAAKECAIYNKLSR